MTRLLKEIPKLHSLAFERSGLWKGLLCLHTICQWTFKIWRVHTNCKVMVDGDCGQKWDCSLDYGCVLHGHFKLAKDWKLLCVVCQFQML
ncbi:hypothetical protein P8452_40839 [Trifolium repens]|nr:hypothetical protein P8452_40839 [Trifolium repens]